MSGYPEFGNLGKRDDPPATDNTSPWSLFSLAKGIYANLASGITGVVAVSNFPATQPVSGAINVSNLPATQPVTTVDGGSTSLGALADGKVTGDNAGSVTGKLRGLTYYLGLIVDTVNSLAHVNVKQVGGTAVKTGSGNGTTGSQNVYIASDQPSFTVFVGASAQNGYTYGKLISAATTNATLVKNSGGTVGQMSAFNNGAANRYVKVYDKASAPTVGTDTPVHTYMIPPGTGAIIPLATAGMRMVNGFGLAITGGITDADTTAIGANEVVVNYLYK